MPEREANEKGVVLFIVLGTLLVVTVLASAILGTINSQSRLTHHQVSRIKAYYAAKGIMNYAQDQIRRGAWALGGGYTYACFASKGCIDGVPNNHPIADDPDIPYKVQVTIYPYNSAGGGVTRLDIKTDYTYTP